MNKQQLEQFEAQRLSPYAMLSKNSRGREHAITHCPLRTEYQRDRDRIQHCKSFRRLMHKTQVFIAPEGDHYRTRLTHTLDVAQIGRTLARALGLNEDLTEAIALGHDIGHTPFGHVGERVLNKISKTGFKHNQHSLRVVEVLENAGQGLNLTYEVKDGIKNHRKDGRPQTLEGRLITFADWIAYINHDIDDALRGGVIKQQELPRDCLEVLGQTHGERINTMILDIFKESVNKPYVGMSNEVYEATQALRQYMFDHVYLDEYARLQEEKADYILNMLYNYYIKHPDEMPQELYIINNGNAEAAIIDYLAGMSDRFAINKFKELFVPKPWIS